MSTNATLAPQAQPNLLGELLHSLSQPLTTLRCSLELSIDETGLQQHEDVAVALEQTEKVIRLVRLLQEYVEVSQPRTTPASVALAPVVQEVADQLTSWAEVRGVRLTLRGNGGGSVLAAEVWVRKALQYAVTDILEAVPAGGEVAIRGEERPAEFVWSIFGSEKPLEPQPLAGSFLHANADPVTCTVLRVRRAIASRVMESGGATLEFAGGPTPHAVLRVPRVEH